MDGLPRHTDPMRATGDRAERHNTGERTPPGGWTEADRVRPVEPRDTSSYPSAEQFRTGSALTGHAIGEDGPGLQLDHGVVVDHPGPEHVTVESFYGTRRISPISHVQPADPHDPCRPARVPAAPAAQSGPARPGGRTAVERWQHLFAGTQAHVLDDPHWPTLAAHLERVAATGHEVADPVDQVLSERALATDHPARSLDYRIANAAPPSTGPRPGTDRDEPAVTRPVPLRPEPGHTRSGPPR